MPDISTAMTFAVPGLGLTIEIAPIAPDYEAVQLNATDHSGTLTFTFMLSSEVNRESLEQFAWHAFGRSAAVRGMAGRN